MEVLPMTLDDLIDQIANLMFFHGAWHAKARGASVFRSAPTALGACRLALGMPAVEDNADLF